MEKLRTTSTRSKARKKRQKGKALQANKYLKLTYDECRKKLECEKRKNYLLSR
jgi:hypothetical protein